MNKIMQNKLNKLIPTNEMARLGLSYYHVYLRADTDACWLIAAKSKAQAKAKALHRCTQAGGSTLKLSDFGVA